MSELEFKPITEGLGFHPFADGLPYAPVSKKGATQKAAEAARKAATGAPASMGTGAVAAGVARPVRFPQAAAARATGTGAVAAGPAIPVRAQPQVQIQTQPRQATSAAAPAPEVERYGFGYLLERVVAFALDSALILAGLAAGHVLA